MAKNEVDKIKGRQINISQEGNSGNSTKNVDGEGINITQKTGNKKEWWQKWGPIGTWVGIVVAIVIALIKCNRDFFNVTFS